MSQFQFKIIARLGRARAGEIVTPHGTVKTPTFMPVGTQASVKSLSPDDLKGCGVQIILGGNTYHIMLQPGLEIIKKAGGMHKFMGWKGAMLTDSGGFQVFSLKGEINDKGVWFTSHLDGSRHFMTPQKSIQIQKINGADIIMAFDHCCQDSAPKARVKEAIERTHRWLKLSKYEWLKNNCRSTTTGKYQALFGIIQGGLYQDLRRYSAEFVAGQNLPGIALGGETIGFNMEKTREVISWVQDLLPRDKPIYTMGLGQNPQDIIDAVLSGIDLFDCVAPTRLARNGSLFTGKLKYRSGKNQFASDFPKGRLNIANASFAKDQKPIDSDCDCFTCRSGFSRSYLRHLFKTRELLYYRLSSMHNIRFMVRLCQNLRREILA